MLGWIENEWEKEVEKKKKKKELEKKIWFALLLGSKENKIENIN